MQHTVVLHSFSHLCALATYNFGCMCRERVEALNDTILSTVACNILKHASYFKRQKFFFPKIAVNPQVHSHFKDFVKNCLCYDFTQNIPNLQEKCILVEKTKSQKIIWLPIHIPPLTDGGLQSLGCCLILWRVAFCSISV